MKISFLWCKTCSNHTSLTVAFKGFVVGNQILKLIFALSFNHNSWKSYLNEQSKGTLSIYASSLSNGILGGQCWRTPKLLNGLKCESKLKTMKEQRVEAHSLACNTLGVEGRVGAPGWDYEKWEALIIHTNQHKTNTRWLVHSWNTFGARKSHGQLKLTRLTTARSWGKPPPSPL